LFDSIFIISISTIYTISILTIKLQNARTDFHGFAFVGKGSGSVRFIAMKIQEKFQQKSGKIFFYIQRHLLYIVWTTNQYFKYMAPVWDTLFDNYSHWGSMLDFCKQATDWSRNDCARSI